MATDRWPSSATWFFITLAPASSVVPIVTEVGAQRRMYLPLIALVVLGVLVVRAAIAWWVPTPRQTGTAIVASAVAWATLTTVSAARGLDYRDSLRIWESVLEARPHGRAFHNLGIVLAARGRNRRGVGRVSPGCRDAARGPLQPRLRAGQPGRRPGGNRRAARVPRPQAGRRVGAAGHQPARHAARAAGGHARRHRSLRAHADDAAGGRRRPAGPRRGLHRPRRGAGRGRPAHRGHGCLRPRRGSRARGAR